MSQQTIDTTEKKVPETGTGAPVEEQLFPREIPLPKVVIDAPGASKNACEAVVNWWRNLPRERQRLFALVGISVITSVTMRLIATVIARLVGKKDKPAK
jgi:hypothetical protein